MKSLLITALQEYLWQNSNHNLWRYKVNRTKTSIVIESYVQQQVSNQQLTDLWSSILFNMLKWPMGLCLHINVSMSITKKKKLLGKHLREQTEQNHSFTFCQKATSYRWWYNCICKVLPSHFFLVHGSLLPFYLFFCNLSIILSNTRLASHIGKFLMS